MRGDQIRIRRKKTDGLLFALRLASVWPSCAPFIRKKSSPIFWAPKAISERPISVGDFGTFPAFLVHDMEDDSLSTLSNHCVAKIVMN